MERGPAGREGEETKRERWQVSGRVQKKRDEKRESGGSNGEDGKRRRMFIN